MGTRYDFYVHEINKMLREEELSEQYIKEFWELIGGDEDIDIKFIFDSVLHVFSYNNPYDIEFDNDYGSTPDDEFQGMINILYCLMTKVGFIQRTILDKESYKKDLHNYDDAIYPITPKGELVKRYLEKATLEDLKILLKNNDNIALDKLEKRLKDWVGKSEAISLDFIDEAKLREIVQAIPVPELEEDDPIITDYKTYLRRYGYKPD
jgi:hypothetical protein